MCGEAGEGMIRDDIKNQIEDIMKKYPCIDSAIVPSLQLLQEQNGSITEDDMEDLSLLLKFPQARIYSAASFYSMLSLRPRGKYHIQICANVSCTLLERETLFDYISRKLDIKDGESTREGLFSIESVECLGSCGYAPAMMINADHYEDVDFKKADEIIEAIRERERIK